jgi:hypothetical protein
MPEAGEQKVERRPLTREDYRLHLPIISKRGRKAYVTTPCFHVRGTDAGWWCNQVNERYSTRWGGYRTKTSGFLLRYEDFKDWYIREEIVKPARKAEQTRQAEREESR